MKKNGNNKLEAQFQHKTMIFRLDISTCLNVDILMANAKALGMEERFPLNTPERKIRAIGERAITQIVGIEKKGFNQYRYFDKVHAKIGVVTNIFYRPGYFHQISEVKSPWVYEIVFDTGELDKKGFTGLLSQDWVERFDKKELTRRRDLIAEYGAGPDRWFGIIKIIAEQERR